ncbi:MAG: phosphoribosylamine--glycine ligase [Actinomycetia bacterium]|nr:phosphoribosylamine--glycine ligase [Actinomycetes bacterium]
MSADTSTDLLKVLVLGGGGREHAIVHALAASDRVAAIEVAPGNGGSAGEPKTTNITLDGEDPAAVAHYVQSNAIDLLVIGPEAPLVAGVADAVRAIGIPVFGPNGEAAQLEGSKQFSKDFMTRNAIPTAAYHVFSADERTEALAKLDEMGAPVVIKADGLAAGKGVTVASTMEEARAALSECFEGRFGTAGDKLVIEECLVGPECSVLCFVDGSTVVPLAPSQDHKRVGEGDSGPNTGGMGVYSPVPLVDDATYQDMVDTMQRVADALVAEGIEYRGVLYGGFMLTDDGPQVLEFNVRFGDPETQVLLPRLRSDLAEVLLATALGSLDQVELSWDDLAGVSVVIASGGYPDSCETGFPITGIEAANELDGVTVYHAGTKRNGDGIPLTSGGRVLNVTALAPTFEEAIQRAYEAVDRIHFEGAFSRRDIGLRALEGSYT